MFRQLDLKLFHRLAPLSGEEERYQMASRDSRETMERLLRAEMERLGEDDETPPPRDSTDMEPARQSV